MEIINKRASSNEEKGVACGPIFIYAVMAEMVIVKDGHIVYEYAEWENQSGEVFFASADRSLYDIGLALNNTSDDEFDPLCDLKNSTIDAGDADQNLLNEAEKEEIHEELKKMIQEILDRDEMEENLFTEYDEEEDEEEDGEFVD